MSGDNIQNLKTENEQLRKWRDRVLEQMEKQEADKCVVCRYANDADECGISDCNCQLCTSERCHCKNCRMRSEFTLLKPEDL